MATQEPNGNHLTDYLLGPVLGIGTYGEVRSAIHNETGMLYITFFYNLDINIKKMDYFIV